MHAFERVDRLSLRIPDYIAIVMWNHVPYGMVQIIEAALITGTIMENGTYDVIGFASAVFALPK